MCKKIRKLNTWIALFLLVFFVCGGIFLLIPSKVYAAENEEVTSKKINAGIAAVKRITAGRDHSLVLKAKQFQNYCENTKYMIQ